MRSHIATTIRGSAKEQFRDEDPKENYINDNKKQYVDSSIKPYIPLNGISSNIV